MAWMGLSLLAANLAPLVKPGVPMEVCSATRSGVRSVDDAQGSARLNHGWQCAQCLPFIATASQAPHWSPAAFVTALPPAVGFQSWHAPVIWPYAARAPPVHA